MSSTIGQGHCRPIHGRSAETASRRTCHLSDEPGRDSDPSPCSRTGHSAGARLRSGREDRDRLYGPGRKSVFACGHPARAFGAAQGAAGQVQLFVGGIWDAGSPARRNVQTANRRLIRIDSISAKRPAVKRSPTGRTQFAFINTAAVVDLVSTGKLRALAIAGPKRLPAFKDVPTVIEAGFPDLAAENWHGSW